MLHYNCGQIFCYYFDNVSMKFNMFCLLYCNCLSTIAAHSDVGGLFDTVVVRWRIRCGQISAQFIVGQRASSTDEYVLWRDAARSHFKPLQSWRWCNGHRISGYFEGLYVMFFWGILFFVCLFVHNKTSRILVMVVRISRLDFLNAMFLLIF